MGRNGLRLINEKYNWGKEEPKLLNLYNSLLKSDTNLKGIFKNKFST